MELKEGTSVFTQSGEDVGKINRFVLDPATHEVTHIVIQKGWLLPEDKVVPIAMVSTATDERVVLDRMNEELDQLPPFEERHFVKLQDEDIRSTDTSTSRYMPAYYWCIQLPDILATQVLGQPTTIGLRLRQHEIFQPIRYR